MDCNWYNEDDGHASGRCVRPHTHTGACVHVEKHGRSQTLVCGYIRTHTSTFSMMNNNKNRYTDNNCNDNEKDDNDKIYIVIRTIRSIMKEIKVTNNNIDNYNDDKDTIIMTITTRQ